MTLKLVSALDNGGKTIDRYTLCFRDSSHSTFNGRHRSHYLIAVCDDPIDSQGVVKYHGYMGFLPHTDENPGWGLPVAFDALPSKVREFVQLREKHGLPFGYD